MAISEEKMKLVLEEIKKLDKSIGVEKIITPLRMTLSSGPEDCYYL